MKYTILMGFLLNKKIKLYPSFFFKITKFNNLNLWTFKIFFLFFYFYILQLLKKTTLRNLQVVYNEQACLSLVFSISRHIGRANNDPL